jgi:anti-sigma factor RsiW
VEAEALHDLTPAYALDALSEAEVREYEEHLARCAQCQEELAGFSQTATALAYGVESPAPSEALRGRILEQARAERSNVVPLRSRRTVAVTRGLAAVAACAAVGFGIWAASLSRALDRERTARESIYAIVSDPLAKRVNVNGAQGSLIVSSTGSAALAISRLPDPPAGKTYEAWVVEGGRPQPAGLFSGGSPAIVRLQRTVPSGAAVAVTLERSGGVTSPQGTRILSAQS